MRRVALLLIGLLTMSVVYSQSFAAGSSYWMISGHTDVNGADPLYPEVWQAEHVRFVAGVGPSGENVLEPWDSDAAIAGLNVRETHALPTAFDITVKVKPSADGLGTGVLMPIFALYRVTSSITAFELTYNPSTEEFELTDQSGSNTTAMSAASLQDAWQTFRFCGVPDSTNGSGAADGSLKVYRNGSLLFDRPGIFLWAGAGATFTMTGYRLGYFGLLGQVTGVRIADTACSATPTIPENESTPCCGDGVAPGTGTGGVGDSLPDNPYQSLQPWTTACAGGGTVPTAADLTDPESWAT